MLEFIKNIQNLSSPFLDTFLTVINFLSQQYFLVALVAFVYWLCDKKKGEALAFSIIFTTAFSCGLKGVFKTNRPFTYDGIRAVNKSTAPGYSFPSADTSAAAATAYTVSGWTEKGVCKILLALYVILVGFARMYFGLHFPTDVLGGLILGLAFAFGIKKIFSIYDNPPLIALVATLILIPFIFFGQQPDYFKTLGLMLGALCGVYTEHTFIHFDYKISRGKKAVRFTVGITGLIVIALFTKKYFPETNFFFVLEKFLLTFFAVGIYPAIFKKLKF